MTYNMPSERKFIPFAPPKIGDEEINEVVDSLRSGWITTGPKVKRFEEEFAKYVGAKYAVATFSCTSALHLSMVGLGIGKGDEVITTPYTFASTAHVILHVGATPVFVDINPGTFQIDENKIEEKISPRTKAILPVHYGGNPCNIGRILEIAKEHDLKVVEDAAHAIGSKFKGKIIGTFGDLTCFSFYATKNLATAEGGMVTTDNEELATFIRKLSMYGISDAREIWKRYAPRGNWFYDIEFIGYKCNMTDLCASLGLHQLKKVEEFNRTRTEYAGIYLKELGGIKGCDFIKVENGNQSCWHVFPLLLPGDVDRDYFIEYLKDKQIGTSVLFRPLHLHTAYRNLMGTREGDFPNAEGIFKRLVCLPVSPAIKREDIEYVAATIKDGILKKKWVKAS